MDSELKTSYAYRFIFSFGSIFNKAIQPSPFLSFLAKNSKFTD